MKNNKHLFLGIFFICLGLLAYEIILTRIFSVILWYHFAFLAICTALFGNGAGAIFLHIFKRLFPSERFEKDMFLFSSLSSVSMIIGVYFILKFSINPELSFKLLSKDFAVLLSVFLLAAIPFLFGGMCLALAMFHRSKFIHKLYFYDLLGAGVGCLLTIPVLNNFGGPGGIIISALFCTIGGFFFAVHKSDSGKSKGKISKAISIMLILIFCCLSVVNSYVKPMFRIRSAKQFNLDDLGIEFTKWNSFSMVCVYPNKSVFHGWAVSSKYQGTIPEQRRIMIDMGALTEITKFNGDLKTVEYAQYDFTSTAHALKKDYRCCVIGPGGGKDVLAALAYGAKDVTAVEINPIIANDIMRGKYSEFSGNVYNHPKVHAVVDDGRSFIRKTDKKFDLLQLSMVDTSAATAAGAYVLSENSLYTADAFLDYYKKIENEGMLSVSWVNMKILEGGTRLVSLARASLEKNGVKDVSKHIVVLKAPNDFNVNLIVKPHVPFTPEETEIIRKRTDELGFKTVHIPNFKYEKDIITDIIYSDNLKQTCDEYHLDVSPVWDDRPFFFYQNRMNDFFKAMFVQHIPDFFGAGLFILAKLLLICAGMTLLFLVVPMFLAAGENKQDILPVSQKFIRILYYVCLGIGFMFVEIPLLQKFSLFLGNPVYSLSVVLLGLLCFSGIGSSISGRFAEDKLRNSLRTALIILVLVIIAMFFVMSPMLKAFQSWQNYMKIPLVIVMLIPLGILLGMCYPAGLRLMDKDSHSLVPWYWAMNSAASVFGSALSVFIAINFGIFQTAFIGALFYLGGFIVISLVRQK